MSAAKTLQARAPELLSETQFSSLVVELAMLGGWKRYHTFNSRRSNHGFPDWVLVKGPRLIFAELKTEAGVLSPEQGDWREALLEVERASKGFVQVYVWRPSDWEAIVETLTGKRCRP